MQIKNRSKYCATFSKITDPSTRRGVAVSWCCDRVWLCAWQEGAAVLRSTPCCSAQQNACSNTGSGCEARGWDADRIRRGILKEN